ncbi:MAG: hypothetical protein P8H25_05920 [Flavobacteriaceae bacterium]|nr:hypothetical protein [Flavobacteriaceae bacterium]
MKTLKYLLQFVGSLKTTTLACLILILILGLVDIFGVDAYDKITLEELETTNAIYFFLFVVIAVIGFKIIQYSFRKKSAHIALGIAIGSLVLLIPLYDSGKEYLKQLTFGNKMPFDRKTWDSDIKKPYKMAVTLVKDKTLIGLSKKEVHALLGEGYYSFESKDTLSFPVDHKTSMDRSKLWKLDVFIKNNKCTNVEMYYPVIDMGDWN